MELQCVSAEEYHRICGTYQYFYNGMEFHELNKDKVEQVVYMIFSEKKNKLALAVGIKEDKIKIPYSSPFGIFEKLQKHIKLEEIEQALDLLEQYAHKNNLYEIFFRLPPVVYDMDFISKLQNCLINKGYKLDICDLNYQFYLRNMEQYYETLYRNARKNLNTAIKQEFLFKHCESQKERKDAYDVIALNRSQKGYPLRMTYEQVEDTIKLTNNDFFILSMEEVHIAAAIIFQVNAECYQVIYWGDISGYEKQRPMNYLAYKVYEYYVKQGIYILDIGPSTEDGIPNYGLCDFKESIGCSVSIKNSYIKRLKR